MNGRPIFSSVNSLTQWFSILFLRFKFGVIQMLLPSFPFMIPAFLACICSGTQQSKSIGARMFAGISRVKKKGGGGVLEYYQPH